MKKTVIVIAVVSILMGAMCAGTVSARAGIIGKAVRSVGAAARSVVAKSRSRVASARAVFTRGRQIFTSGRALFTRARQIFTSGRALFTRGRAVFSGVRATFNRGRSFVCLGRALFSFATLRPLNGARLLFKSMRLGFKASRLRFKSLRLHFKATRLRFKALRLGFKATRLRFKALRLGFKATRLRFKALRLRFKSMRLKFKALRLGAGALLRAGLLGLGILALAKMKGQQQQQQGAGDSGAVGEEATGTSMIRIEGVPSNAKVTIVGGYAIPKESESSSNPSGTSIKYERERQGIISSSSTKLSVTTGGSQEESSSEDEYEIKEFEQTIYADSSGICEVQVKTPGQYIATVEAQIDGTTEFKGQAGTEDNPIELMEPDEVKIVEFNCKQQAEIEVPVEIDWENIDDDSVIQLAVIPNDDSIMCDEDEEYCYVTTTDSNGIEIACGYTSESIYNVMDVTENGILISEVIPIVPDYMVLLSVNDDVIDQQSITVLSGENVEVATIEYPL